MSPTRRIINRRGYLTEVRYENGRFREVPLSRNQVCLPNGVAAPESRREVDSMRRRLDETEARVRTAHADHLGYPYNLTGLAAPFVAANLGRYLVNNLGDPYAGSHFASEVCALEREAVAWLMDLWECDGHDGFWGSVGASGTEGNLWALYLAREALPDAPLIHSNEAHYSIPKAARILRMEAISVACSADGAIDLDDLSAVVATLEDRPLIVALTCGTTVKGAHDDIAGVLACLEAGGVPSDRRFVHVDGALNAMVLPFVEEAPASIRPSFRHAIDSLSTSGHKMIGTPMPCGVLVARLRHVQRIASAIAYLRSNDTTLMGSRNGHAVAAIWSRLVSHGVEGFRADVNVCLERAVALARDLRAAEVPTLLNDHALTVVFPEPAEDIVRKYQLACDRGRAHAIIMPSVADGLISRFRDEYVAWWQHHVAGAGFEPPGSGAFVGVLDGTPDRTPRPGVLA